MTVKETFKARVQVRDWGSRPLVAVSGMPCD